MLLNNNKQKTKNEKTIYIEDLVCVCLRPSTLKASSVWGWKSRVQINDVVLITLFSSAKFLHRYFSMNHQAFLTSHFILFAH